MQTISSTSEIVFEKFKESLAELIGSYTDIDPMIGEGSMRSNNIELEITSIVGLSCENVAVTVSLASSQQAALSLSNFPLACARDWIGELANQLAGRLKNKMCNYGLSLNLTTPTTVRGNHLELSTSALESFLINAAFPGGAAIAQLALKIDPSIELSELPTEPTSEEGSLELF